MSSTIKEYTDDLPPDVSKLPRAFGWSVHDLGTVASGSLAKSSYLGNWLVSSS